MKAAKASTNCPQQNKLGARMPQTRAIFSISRGNCESNHMMKKTFLKINEALNEGRKDS